MRFLLYIAILAVAFVFITNSYQNITRNEIVEIIPQGVVVDPNAGLDNTPAKTDTKTDAVVKVDDTLNKADEKALQQIQENINKANDAIKEIEKKNSAPNAAPQPIPARLSQQELYDKAESRVVNFFCSKPGGVRVASGVMISSKGHILTNAHVAEGFEKDYECMIRQGSPARSIGYAKLIMYPAATHNIMAVIIVVAIFGLTTISTMMAIVLSSYYGLSKLPLRRLASAPLPWGSFSA